MMNLLLYIHYEEESDDEYPLNVNLSIPIPGVMIQIVQASLGATSLSYNSTMHDCQLVCSHSRRTSAVEVQPGG